MFDERKWRSASQLKMMSDCGEQYRLIKEERVPSKPAAWTVRGIAVHHAIEEWERSSRELDPVKFLEDVAWPQAYEKTVQNYPDVDNWIRTPGTKNVANDLKLRQKESPDHVSVYCDRAIREEKQWRVWERPVEDPRIPDGTGLFLEPAVEINFKLEFPEFWVVGYIDQIIEWYGGESYTIKDIKSGRDTKEDNRQLGIYAAAANEMFGLNIRYGTYHYTKLDKDTGLKDLSVYTREYLHNQYLVLDSMVKAKHFLANPERDKCAKFCGVFDHCREWKTPK